jgi:gliding motility-associated lipoprotein GldH
MPRYWKSTGIFILLAILFVNCDNQSLYDQVSALPDARWSAKEPVVFEFPVSDTAVSYEILFHIRNQQNYAYSNIWMFIEITAPNGYVKRDTFEIMLADEGGRWYGSGIGNVNSMLVPYKDDAVFPMRGIYKVSLTQAMYDDPLDKIMDIGLRIQRHIE